MKNNSTLIIVFAFILMFAVSCGENESKPQDQEGRSISVKAQLVNTSSIELKNEYTGTVEGEEQTVIYSKIAEAVSDVHVKEGDRIKKNQVLVSLDKTGPSSNLTQAQSLFINAEKNYKKMEYLFSEGAISEMQFDAAQTEYEVKKASYEAALRLVDIESPIAGTVTSLNVSKGDFVNVGQKLATVAQSENIRVKFNVNINEINNFTLGSRVDILSESINSSLPGEVVSIANSADPVNRAFQVEALVDNSSNQLKPGMFVRIAFIEKNLEDVIVIPRKTILTLDEKETVFIVQNGKAFGKQIVLGPDVKGSVVVENGLNIGDTLVTLGQDYLEDNIDVNISEIE